MEDGELPTIGDCQPLIDQLGDLRIRLLGHAFAHELSQHRSEGHLNDMRTVWEAMVAIHWLASIVARLSDIHDDFVANCKCGVQSSTVSDAATNGEYCDARR